jgi:hypothetical protein
MWLSKLRLWLAKRRVRAIEERITITEDELEYWHYAHARAKERVSEESLRYSIARTGNYMHQHSRRQTW